MTEPTASIAATLTGIRFSYDGGEHWALDGVDLTVRTGEYVCLTGANGSGKSTLARLVAGLAAPDDGDVTLLGHHVFSLDVANDADAADAAADPADAARHAAGFGADPAEYRAARRSIGAVFQNPEDQLVTTVTADDVAFGPENLGLDRATIGARINESLDAVDMAAHRFDDPTRMSGGQQQRVAIADMLAMHPAMLVLDEPTAMLDPAARAEVMRILDELHARGTTIVHVTHHDDEVVRAGRVVRLQDGRIVEDVAVAPARDHVTTADDGRSDGHPSRNIAETATPPADARSTVAPEHRSTTDHAALPADVPAITVSHVTYRYPSSDAPAINDLSLTVTSGETIAIMGENGAGKSTLARLLCALDTPTSGSITVAGIPVAASSNGTARRPRTLDRRQRARLRRTVGFVMQHPERQLFADTVADDIAYGPRNQQLSENDVAARVTEAMRLLHIEHLADRSPFSLSGGQQRLVAIAGVIACRPRVLVMDEPTASLDDVATARIHDLIRTLRSQGVTVLIITHSPAEAQEVADRVVMLGGGDATATVPTTPPSGVAGSSASSQPRATRNSSYIARLDPRVKMVTFLAMMFTAFAIATPAQLALGAALVAGIVAASRIRPLRLLASVHMFLAMFVVMGLLNIFFVRSGDVLVRLGPIPVTDDGITIAVLYALRFALVIILGAVMLETTTPTALTDGFGSLLSPLARLGVHTQEIALVMSLALRFLPTLGTEAKAIADAQAARGGSIETGSPAARLRAMTALCVPMFAGAIRHADNLSLALDARCYEEGIRRTHWHELRVRPSDLAFAALAVVYIVALIALPLVVG
ncbi:cobalt ABC transporter [Bifidobacterium ramosum]|uniref:ATP-binding cassette domain-containing protein n=1 Tax=Bifidobacterium ramosum TaxID=1798158 RepID=A0A6L4X202_9BIFI|nr:energy-coupling factor transporter ATPase [Bifidobacterium ramosum]KAB8287667.1 cobalt ABC transporter [Bifidobacterium ramosum]NEG72303.1 ATP-binding cassette domain-containing protein [Bifidobacterium ramosum]